MRSSEALSFGPTLAPGTVVGGYDVVRCIGTGGVGVVYEARHRRLDKPVALKALHVGLAQDPKMRERFLREGRVAAKLSHPHVVGVSDVALEGDVPYLVMELLRGEDLSALILRESPLGVERTIDLLIPIVSALTLAHSCGIIHRDLKPQNVFLSVTVSGTIVPKVLDFGISKHQVEAVSDLTQSRVILGTPHYMSPEQACGARCIDPRSDQFSLGVVAYECISGLRPFAGDSLLAVLNSVTRDDPPPLRSFAPQVPEQLDAIIARMTAKSPKERFDDMRAVGEALLPYASSRVRLAFENDFLATTTADVAPSSAVCTHLSSNTERCTPYPWAIGTGISSGWTRWRFPLGAAAVIVSGLTLIHIARAGTERRQQSEAAPRWDELPRARTWSGSTSPPPMPSLPAPHKLATMLRAEPGLDAASSSICSRKTSMRRGRSCRGELLPPAETSATPSVGQIERGIDDSAAGPSPAAASIAQDRHLAADALPVRRGVNGAPILP